MVRAEDERASPVVGREVELAGVRRLLARATSGPAGLVLSGEPGIGKTTLFSAGVHEAEAAGFRVLRTQPTTEERRWGFAALADLLDAVPAESFEELPAPQRTALEIAVLRREPVHPPPEPRAIALATTSLLRGLAGSGPVLVAIDDLQWLDAASASVIAYAIRRLQAPFGLLATQRLAPSDRLAVDLERSLGADEIERLTIGPLALGSLHRLLVERLGTSFSHLTVVRIRDAARGNPFLALEVGRELRRIGSRLDPGASLPISRTITELLGGRVARLPQRTRRALLLIAAGGPPSTQELRAVLGSEPGSALAPAFRQGIVEYAGELVRFSHPLLASAVLAAASDADVRGAHRALAGASGDLEASALHLGRAVIGPDEQIAETLTRAAERARARGATPAAVELMTLACRLTPTKPVQPQLDRRLTLAHLLLEAGEGAAAERELAALMAEAHGSIRARAAIDAARLAQNRSGFRAATELCESVLPEVGDNPAELARVHAMASRFADFDPGLKMRHAVAAKAALADIPQADAELELLVLAALVEAEGSLGHDLPAALTTRVVELEATVEPSIHSFNGSGVIAAFFESAAEFDDARRWLVPTLSWAIEHTLTRYPRHLGHLVHVETGAERWAEAERLSGELFEWADQLEQPLIRTWALGLRAQLDARLGRIDLARSTAEEALSGAEASGDEHLLMEAHVALGFVELAAGGMALAARHLEQVDEIRRRIGVVEPAFLFYRADHVEALAASGQLERAEAASHSFEADAAAAGRAWGLATSARGRALVEAARGDVPAAAEAIALALERHKRLPLAFERARTLLVAAQIHRRMRARAAAQEALREALGIFVGLGAATWAERVRSMLARIGVRGDDGVTLTARELEVARLVAQGFTNREIAERVFLAEKTVEGKLSRIYQKLSVQSRAELATWLARADRSPAPNQG